MEWRNASDDPKDDTEACRLALDDGSSFTDPSGVAWLHFSAIRVNDEGDIQEPYDDEVEEEYEGLQSLYGPCAFQTCEIKGFPGRWIVYAVPYGD